MTTTRSTALLGTLTAAFLSGCANQVDTATAECGAGGAGAAYLICKATGHTDQQCLIAAGVSGGIGAVACHVYASNLDARRRQLEADRYSLDGQIRYVQGLNEDVTRLNGELRTHVADATRRADTLRSQIASRSIGADQIARQRKALASEADAARKQVTAQRAALEEATQFQARQKQPSPQLDAEIARQTRLLSDAQQQVDTLSSLSERV